MTPTVSSTTDPDLATDPSSATRPAAPDDYGFGEAEAELRDLVRRFLAEQFPVTRLRELVAADHTAVYARGEEAGWDREVWAAMVDMGLTALAVPEDAGGTPVSLAGLAAVAEEVGHRAVPSPLASTITATLVLNHCDRDAARHAEEALHAVAPLLQLARRTQVEARFAGDAQGSASDSRQRCATHTAPDTSGPHAGRSR